MTETDKKDELSAMQAEYRKIQLQFRLTGVFSILVLAFGTVFYHVTEHFTWLDSLYFCTITLTTIGYGDITPKTSLGKAFTILYVIIGIGIIAYFVNILFKNAFTRRQLKRKSKNKQ